MTEQTVELDETLEEFVYLESPYDDNDDEVDTDDNADVEDVDV